MRELSVTEQRYKAVVAVIGDGRTVTEVARDWNVSRETLHQWLRRYEDEGLEGLANRSHRPTYCPHQMPPEIEAQLLELRRAKPYLGARRLVLELARKGVQPAPSKSAVHRSLTRAGVIDPERRLRRAQIWKRWERAMPMELWQLDIVHGFLLADGTSAKALTGIDDHSRFCVSARLMLRERTQAVCDGFSSALREYGIPAQVLTDNGKVFTGRFAQPPVEVLFDRICRENGVDHILTAPRTPTTTGKIERFHPHAAHRVQHSAGVSQPEDGTGGSERVGELLQHAAPSPGARRRDAGEPLSCPPGESQGTGTTGRTNGRAMGVAAGGAQRHCLRRLAAHQRGQALRRQHLRRPGHRRPISVLGRQRPTQDCRQSHAGDGDPQKACRTQGATVNNSRSGVSQMYRNSYVAEEPKAYIGTTSTSGTYREP